MLWASRVGYSRHMTNVDELKVAVGLAMASVVEAQGVFLTSLAEQWRDMATEGFRKLATELQPEITQALGDGFAEARAMVARVINEGADRVPELFAPASEPERLVVQVKERTYGRDPISINFGGFDGPIEVVAQPLHDALTSLKYNPDLIKQRGYRASYSSSGFTESDFPLSSSTVQSAYTKALNIYAKARFALTAAEKQNSADAAQNLWNRPRRSAWSIGGADLIDR
jgi:hypothetical protein